MTQHVNQYFQITANSVVAFSGFMMACFPESFYIVTLSRFIGGIGHGFAYVTVIQHFGELCEDKLRGKIGTLVHLFIVHGILMSSSSLVKVFLQYDFLMDPNKFLGLHVFLYNIVAAVIVFFFYKESIVTLIESRRDEAAKRIMRIIRSESEDTLEISESFNEMKMMVDEDRKKKPGIFSEGNLKPLIVVTLLRVCYVISYNYSMKYLDIFMTHHIDLGIDYSFITNVISPIGSVIAVYTIEKGRRIHFFLSACGTFLIFIIFGSVQASTTSDNGFFNLFMIIGFKFFSALGLGLLTHIYSAEAFALPKKTASIAFTSIIESFLQIVIIILVNSQIQSSNFDLVLLFASAGLLLPIIIFMFFMLPETKQVSLRVARSKFL